MKRMCIQRDCFSSYLFPPKQHPPGEKEKTFYRADFRHFNFILFIFLLFPASYTECLVELACSKKEKKKKKSWTESTLSDFPPPGRTFHNLRVSHNVFYVVHKRRYAFVASLKLWNDRSGVLFSSRHSRSTCFFLDLAIWTTSPLLDKGKRQLKLRRMSIRNKRNVYIPLLRRGFPLLFSSSSSSFSFHPLTNSAKTKVTFHSEPSSAFSPHLYLSPCLPVCLFVCQSVCVPVCPRVSSSSSYTRYDEIMLTKKNRDCLSCSWTNFFHWHSMYTSCVGWNK